ncbi:1-deoxy-D-xylulose 5-phosphate reductoisomerase [Rubrobacter xylanophilus]|uniref:1-deoxy-D-xylulose 5-phosphate reductoisomerase n=1 Tax=Rubrobacter xylanophilus TaxID=49319 RepID=A0A510HJR8_9ACTN|nr:1-deoxy-D-xylulose-5-phosphate reductoisomerase [Rubrobacter xylanophilus]BBL78863.1 1-deoxy-D-xylulose 5-phosphate reductoisomerase [Rubrobacter xylanophilus]
MRRRVTILGSTGSIGTQALDVIGRHPGRFEVVGLAASSNAALLRRQVEEFSPRYVALENGDATGLGDCGARVFSGPGAAARLAAVPADVVLNAVVGFAGLAATVSALRAKNRLALANKESVVAGGEWVMELARGGALIPVDSEHSAIFQCLEGRRRQELSHLLLTASGGPFFDLDAPALAGVGPEDALKHPTWRMGAKITVDSATMMNKGLEVIEAHHLFDVPYDRIRVVVHRQSAVHGGVLFSDGSAILHAAPTDMRLPIAYALLYPERIPLSEPLPLAGQSWTFEEPRDDLFRCLPLAVAAGEAGGPHPAALNAANEVAVQAFLDRRIKFLQIPEIIEEVLEIVPDFGPLRDLETIEAVDRWAREEAGRRVKART